MPGTWLVPVRTSVSFARLGTPLAARRAPTPAELTQPRPCPTGELFAHGQAVPVPSPTQNDFMNGWSAVIVPTSEIEPVAPVPGSLNANTELIGATRW